MSAIFNEIKFTLRRIRKRPVFTVIVILVLGLGIGATTAIFSVVHKVLWEPLPLPYAQRLVGVWECNPEKGQTRMGVSPPNFLDWQEEADVFDEIAAYTVDSLVLTGEGRPLRCKGLAVTEDYFRLAGVTPVWGRTLYAEDTQPGTHPVVLISQQLWHTRFDADPNLIGRTITLNNEPYTVIGVVPDDNILNEGTQLWVPLKLGAQSQRPGMRGARYLRVLARLRKNVTAAQAQDQMCMLAVRIGERDPINQGWNVCVIGLRDQMVASVRPSLWVLLGGAGLLLLAACANVTNLLITRMMHRQSDLATRQALGATRLDLLSHVLTENLLLAGLGGVPGLWIAWWSVHLITGMSPWDIPRLGQAGMNLRVLLFWMGLVLLSGLTCGLLCAGRCLSRALTRHLQGRDAQTLAPHSRERLRGLLVVTETALSVILLIVTGLMARSFWSLQGVDPGFSPENVHTMAVSLPAAQYPEAHQQCAFFRQLLERVQDLPGVIDAGLATNLPLSGTVMTFGYNTFDHSPWDSEQNLAQYHAISSDYFKTMGITLLHGRAFSSSDRADGPQVVIVSDTLAQKLWNKSNVVGQHIGLANDGMRKREIIGVVNSVKHQGLDADLVPEVYVPYEQNPWSFMTLVVRSSGQGLFMAVTLRDQLRALDPDLPPDAIVSLADLMHTSLGPMRFRAFLIGLFSITAVLLAVVGLYAMVSYTSARRSWEFGMRIALGAQARQVLGMVLIQGLQLCLIGVTLGLTTAWALTRTLRSLLYGISPTDPAVFISAALIVTGIALLACWIPARRAAKIDPMEALRYE